VNLYFLGIAGAGMSALASILVTEGHTVSGSDDGVFPPVTTYLDRLAIPYHVGFDAALVPPGLDAAVIGSSAKLDLADNPELAELKRRDTALYSFPEFLGRHTAGRDTVVVAGSFGKSSVTALLAVILTEAGGDPGYFIGAVPLDLPLTGRSGSDPIFVMEGDEYIVGPGDRRSKFALYAPKSLMITSLIHDHVNVFPTMADYEAPFAELIAGVPVDALLVCAHPFDALHRLAAGRRRVVWYGREPCPGYYAENLAIGEVTRFDLVTPANARIPLETELLGLHNIENIVGAGALLLERGDVGVEALQRGVRRFRGVARRLDKKTTASRVPAYEGFGSSYEKARSAIEAILLHFPDRPCVVVFEPHTFSWRDPAALAWYDSVFEGVARVLLLPPPRHGAGQAQSTQDQIAERIAAAGVPVTAAEDGSAVLADLAATLTGDEVILLLSSGPLDALPETLPPWLETRFAP
jgi:UDP-N-acetylmuramate: L-alanyl-gamma-D-glutamyl-meso-diaminopimelate ligase